ncbi:glycosyltransferase [Pseudarthrobacter siccitolerans]|uniref:glycosyltransferase n=1 Tax=Pseudarthrobacter siccitolerans TaxID=861266 RepID=UPI000679E42E|nr:glycosyltransferase [Pseudarthrobacter siccitolerans]
MARSVAIVGTRGYPSYYGGFETAVRRLAPHLIDAGWATTVYGRPGGARLDDPLCDPRVKSVVTKGIETKSLSTLSFGLTSALHAIWTKPEVALVMNVANGFWLPLFRMRGIPTVVNVDGMEWERAKWGRIARQVFKAGALMTARFATTIVADSREIQRRWKEEFGRDGVFIPYGGDVSSVLGVENGLTHRGYILLVARFVAENSIQEFFDAVRLIPSNYQIVMVGSSGYGGHFDTVAAELADAHANVSWLGHINDHERLLSLWQHAGAYFHGHSVGGTNPALVQAMACGTPVVARDTVYNREVLADAGTFTGVDPDRIAATLTQMMESPELQERQSQAGIRRFEAEYTWESVCDKYVKELEVASSL